MRIETPELELSLPSHTPHISVVMPVYNAAPCLSVAVESILGKSLHSLRFRSESEPAEDYDLWVRLTDHCRIVWGQRGPGRLVSEFDARLDSQLHRQIGEPPFPVSESWLQSVQAHLSRIVASRRGSKSLRCAPECKDIGASEDGTKELLAVVDSHRESSQSWRELLQELKRRGVSNTRSLAIDHGSLGVWMA